MTGFTPLVTLALFLGQVFSDDHSCRSAVARLLAWRRQTGCRNAHQTPADTAKPDGDCPTLLFLD